MENSAPVPKALRFGLFELDLQAGELRKSGVKIKLQEQPLQVLIALLQKPGEVVTREKIRASSRPCLVVATASSLR